MLTRYRFADRSHLRNAFARRIGTMRFDLEAGHQPGSFDTEGTGGEGGGTGGTGGSGGEGGSSGGEGGEGGGEGGAGTGGDAGSDPPKPAKGEAVLLDLANADDVAKLPQWLQDELKRSRDDAAKGRTGAKQLQDQLEAFKKDIAKALGIAPEEETPEKLKERLEAEATEKATLAAENKRLRLRDVVRTATDAESADFDLTFSYLLGNDQLEKFDLASDTLKDDVLKAVQAAVKAKPNLKANGQAPKRSGLDPSRRPADGEKPKDLSGAVTAHYSDSD